MGVKDELVWEAGKKTFRYRELDKKTLETKLQERFFFSFPKSSSSWQTFEWIVFLVLDAPLLKEKSEHQTRRNVNYLSLIMWNPYSQAPSENEGRERKGEGGVGIYIYPKPTIPNSRIKKK